MITEILGKENSSEKVGSSGLVHLGVPHKRRYVHARRNNVRVKLGLSDRTLKFESEALPCRALAF